MKTSGSETKTNCLGTGIQNRSILLTGFAPFGGETVNPSYEAVKGLPDIISGWQVIKAKLPVEYDGSQTELDKLIEDLQPAMVICDGQAGGRVAITPEYVAINLQNNKAADNAGVLRTEQPILKDGADAYISNLPVLEIVRALQDKGIPAQVSYSAGTYVCNTVMYHLMNYIKVTRPQMLGGFIHVPYSCEQAAQKGEGAPSLPISVMTAGLQYAVETCVSVIEREGTD